MSTETDEQALAPVEDVVDLAAQEAEQVESEESEATADEETGDEDTAAPDEPKKPSKGVQKRLDELTRLRHDAERDRDHWREMAMRQGAQPPTAQEAVAPTDAKPQESQFEDYDAWQRALTKWEVREELRAEQQQASVQQRRDALFERASAKYEDFGSVINNPNLPITPLMGEVILDSAAGEDLAYHLATNPAEASRIAALSPARQAAEMGKLEARLTAPPPSPRNPPPAPPKTVNGITAGTIKDPNKMTMAEYAEWRKSSP